MPTLKEKILVRDAAIAAHDAADKSLGTREKEGDGFLGTGTATLHPDPDKKIAIVNEWGQIKSFPVVPCA